MLKQQNRPLATSIVALCILTGLVVWLAVATSGKSDVGYEPALAAIPRAQLEAGGLKVARPEAADASAAKVSREEAIAIALKADPDAVILEVVLARLENENVVEESRYDLKSCLCWVVSVDPSKIAFNANPDGMGGTSGPIVPQYSIIVINALTGDPLFRQEGSIDPDLDGRFGAKP